MRIIRQKLDGGTTFPKNLRYNSETDTVEQTYDNGETWVENELANPRTSTALIQAKPPRDTRCQTAANARAFLQANLAQVIEVLTQFDGAAGVVGALVTILIAAFLKLGPFGIIVALFFALATYLVGIGKAALEYAFIADEWDIVLCNIYANTPEGGLYTQEDLDEIISLNAGTLNTTAAGVVNGMLLLLGFVGLTNAGKTGEETAYCGGCEDLWCMDFDFTTGQHGWAVVSPYGTYVSGEGFRQTTGQGLIIQYTFADTVVTMISMTGQTSGATAPRGWAIIGRDNGVNQFVDTTAIGTSFAGTADWTGSVTIDQILLNPYGGSFAQHLISAAHVEGTGTNPFGVSNCED